MFGGGRRSRAPHAHLNRTWRGFDLADLPKLAS